MNPPATSICSLVSGVNATAGTIERELDCSNVAAAVSQKSRHLEAGSAYTTFCISDETGPSERSSVGIFTFQQIVPHTPQIGKEFEL